MTVSLRLFACGQGRASLAAIAVALVVTAVVPGTAATLDELYAAAKKEGALSIIAPPEPKLRVGLIEAMQKRFPEIKVDISGMPGNKAAVKVQSEARAGVHAVDVVINGTTTGIRGLKPGGHLVSLDSLLVLPEVRNPANWVDNEIPYSDPEKQVIAMMAVVTPAVVVNTDLVKPGEITSDADLLDPKWKGKIVINNPLVPGNANKQFRRIYDLHGADYVRKFAAQEPVVIADLRQAMDWVVKGRYAIGFGMATTVIDQYVEKGVKNISTDPLLKWKDTLYLSPSFGGLMVIKDMPHPAATKLFVNWALTDEGQTVIATALNSPSYRKGVNPKGVPEYVKMQPNGKYLETYSEKFLDLPAEKHMQDLVKSLNIK